MVLLRQLQTFLVCFLALIISSSLTLAVELGLKGAKFSISSIDGSPRISESFDLQKSPKVSSPLAIESDEVLRLSFVLQSKDGEKLSSDQQPHQIVVNLSDPEDEQNAFTSIVTMKRSTGKATFNQKFNRLPNSLLRTKDGLVKVDLLIGSFDHSSNPIRLSLATIQLPNSLISAGQQDSNINLSLRQRKQIQQGFHRHEDHHHTFNIPAADQMPAKVITLSAAIVTLTVPWAVFLGLYQKIAPSLNVQSSSTYSPFVASLIALEILAFVYWQGLGLTLFKLIPWLLVFSLVAVFTGRNALQDMRKIRLGKKTT